MLRKSLEGVWNRKLFEVRHSIHPPLLGIAIATEHSGTKDFKASYLRGEIQTDIHIRTWYTGLVHNTQSTKAF